MIYEGIIKFSALVLCFLFLWFAYFTILVLFLGIFVGYFNVWMVLGVTAATAIYYLHSVYVTDS